MKIGDIAQRGARFLLKSEYGALAPNWPVVAFTSENSATQIRRKYQNGRDFILYLGTRDEKTLAPSDRGNLLSLCEIDTTRTFRTYDHISKDALSWAEQNYPSQWLRCFRVIRGFNIPTRPDASQLLRNTNTNLWRVPIREVASGDLESLFALDIELLNDVDILSRSGRKLEVIDMLQPENVSEQREAIRLAQLVFNRVKQSGEVVQRRAPERSAPSDLQLQIFELLMCKPLSCALCGGEMSCEYSNSLLKISGDRKVSSHSDYGPDNYQLVHYACNLAKNNATAEEFYAWLEIVRDVRASETEC